MTTTTDLLRREIERLQAVLCDPEGKASIQGSTGDLREIDEALTSLLALADQMERAEPVGTVRTCVWNGQGWTVSLIVPIKMCVGDPLYTHPAPEVTRPTTPAECSRRIHELQAEIAGLMQQICGAPRQCVSMQEPKPCPAD